MVKIYGKKYSRNEIRKYVGEMFQIAGVKGFQLIDGNEYGVRGVLVKNGSGLLYTVLLDRGMDISYAEFKGMPIGWRSPTGDVSPQFFEPWKYGWLRGFYGGLLTTCGLTYAGAPCIDRGEKLGLHGRISYIPAKNVMYDGIWINDEYILFVQGKVRETSMFGPNIVLNRRIETKVGCNRITIYDRIVNEGFEGQPLMIIYHFNIGFPIVDDGSRLYLTTIEYFPRDEEARKDVENFNKFHEPIHGYKEKVYFHKMAVDSKGYAYAGIVNPRLNMGIYVKYRVDELNRFIEWKMMGEQFYVIGIEPSNCLVLGRARERELGTLQYIEPEETREFHLEVNIMSSKEEIENFIKLIRNIVSTKPKLIDSLEKFIK